MVPFFPLKEGFVNLERVNFEGVSNPCINSASLVLIFGALLSLNEG